MKIPLPKPDNAGFKETYENMRKIADSTDYSDPMDTLIELFALLIDMQRFYMSQIRDEHRAKYLKLLGHGSQESFSYEMNKIYRAVTAEDYENLVMQMPGSKNQKVKAVCCPGNIIKIYVKNYSTRIAAYLEPYRLITTKLIILKDEGTL